MWETLEQQFAITDHQGNTRVVFTTATPTAQAVTANYEGATNSNVLNYPSGGGRNSQELFDHTDVSGSTYTYSQLLNGGINSQVGVAKSYKVYPGDKVKIEAYAKYYNPQGTSSNIAGFAAALTTAFNLTPGMPGEAGRAYQALNSWGTVVATGGGMGAATYPKMFVNILIFDKDHNFLDVAYEQINGGEQVGATPKAAHDFMSREYTVKEAGYAYVYLSNESATYVEAYFDDVVFTYTPTAVVQYNDYYPFGLQASTSWTRENITGNNFLYNAGSELNKTSGWYETFFRGYDAALGRFMQVDPLATMAANRSTFHYAGNDPVNFNDPMGDAERPTPDDRNPVWEARGVGLMDPYSFRASMLSNSWSQSAGYSGGGGTIIIDWNEIPDGMSVYPFSNGQPGTPTVYSPEDVQANPALARRVMDGSTSMVAVTTTYYKDYGDAKRDLFSKRRMVSLEEAKRMGLIEETTTSIRALSTYMDNPFLDWFIETTRIPVSGGYKTIENAVLLKYDRSGTLVELVSRQKTTRTYEYATPDLYDRADVSYQAGNISRELGDLIFGSVEFHASGRGQSVLRKYANFAFSPSGNNMLGEPMNPIKDRLKAVSSVIR